MATYTTYPKGTASFDTSTPPPSTIAEYLKTPTGTVYIASNTPSIGMVLIATSSTNATWQTPSAYTTINDLRIEGNATNTATAAGALSVALGRNTYAGGLNSITLGPNCTTASSTSVVVGNSCSTTVRSGAGNGDACVIVGSGSSFSNSGGAGLGAYFANNISIGADNTSVYASGNAKLCDNNTLIGPNNVLTIAHQNNFRRNFFFTQGHTVTTDVSHAAGISDNIIIGRGGSYTSDGVVAGDNVVIGTGPKWSGCNKTVLVGANITAPLKNGVCIGADSTVPATDTCVVIGYGTTFSAAATNMITVTTNSTISSGTDGVIVGANTVCAGNYVVVVGKAASVSADYGIGIGANSVVGVSGLNGIAIGNVSAATQNYAIGIGFAATSQGTNGIVIGPNASNLLAPSSVAIGSGASVTSVTAASALGANAIVDTGATNAVQLSGGTNSTANSLQFKSSQIHDGATPAASQLVYKSTTAGNYKGGNTYNLYVNEGVAPYTGVLAGRKTNDPNRLQFSDYDPAFGRDLASYAFSVFRSSNAISLLFRDGMNLLQGEPTTQLEWNGWDEKWGCNTFWRYMEAVTETYNLDTLIPFVTVPRSHFCNMELTVTAMRTGLYIKNTNTLADTGSGQWLTDPSKVGGRTWTGVGCVYVMGTGTVGVCDATNNWGGSTVIGDPGPIVASAAGNLISRAIAYSTPHYVSSGTNTVTGVAVQSLTLAHPSDIAYVASVGKGIMHTSCQLPSGMGSFSDYELRGFAFIYNHHFTDSMVVCLVVKGKQFHTTDWKISARCTITPFSDPALPGP